MDPSILAQLEAAAVTIMVSGSGPYSDDSLTIVFVFCCCNFQAPPNEVNPEQRRQAEAIFTSFRNSKGLDALNVCQYILGKCGFGVLGDFLIVNFLTRRK